MTSTSQATHHGTAYRAAHAARLAAAEHQPQWMLELREQAMARFEAVGFPTARRGNEPWKYTDASPIAEATFGTPPTAGPEPLTVALKPFALPCARVHEIVFIDGRYTPQMSSVPGDTEPLPAGTFERHASGLVVGRLAEAIHRELPQVRAHLSKHAGMDANAFTALNTAFIEDGAFVWIPDDAVVTEPIYLLFIGTGKGDAYVTHPRVLVVAGKHSKASVIVSHEHLGDGGYFSNAVTEAVLGPGAHLGLWRLQRESARAFHVATTQATLGRDSTLTSASAELGGKLARHDFNVTLAEQGASCRVNGVYVTDGTRHVDTHTFIDHAVPRTTSNEVFKGILSGDSRGVFVGNVLVRPDAQRSEAHQLNKNLLLSSGAHVDTQPRLEIFADDVQCTHGAAVGSLDDAALFYLKSRGIGEGLARVLLTHGFMREVIESITDEAVRQHLDTAVEATLPHD
ncbi:MAG: Fe-S cluster assembly protein SufD [SAR202 cluster bacterium]|nr:Fe-S cluster assembly protein SufD [SAR202 cluster bacterium]